MKCLSSNLRTSDNLNMEFPSSNEFGKFITTSETVWVFAFQLTIGISFFFFSFIGILKISILKHTCCMVLYLNRNQVSYRNIAIPLREPSADSHEQIWNLYIRALFPQNIRSHTWFRRLPFVFLFTLF